MDRAETSRMMKATTLGDVLMSLMVNLILRLCAITALLRSEAAHPEERRTKEHIGPCVTFSLYPKVLD